MPVYFPHLLYREDGCEVIQMNPDGEPYVVVSGDGSCIDEKGTNSVAVEFKCPIPNKQFVTDLSYTLPTYHSTQVLSQMAAKGSRTFSYMCYTEESSSLILGDHDSVNYV